MKEGRPHHVRPCVRASRKTRSFTKWLLAVSNFEFRRSKEAPTFVIDFVKIINFRPNRRQGTVLEALKNDHFLNTFLTKRVLSVTEKTQKQVLLWRDLDCPVLVQNSV